MELQFFGTSSGVPTSKRNVSGLALRTEGSKSWVLIDCGEGTQHRIMQSKLSLNKLEAILITHVHGDHCYGLPGLLASAAMQGRTHPLLITGPASVFEYLQCVRNSSQLRLSFRIDFRNVEEKNSVETSDFKIEFIKLSHRVPSFAYVFIEAQIENKLDIEKLRADGISPGPVWGKLQNGLDVDLENSVRLKSKDYVLKSRNPRKIIICGDNDNPDLLRHSAENSNLLVHEATYTKNIADRIGKAPQHCSSEAIAQFSQSISLANLILTHFSPRYQDDTNQMPSIKDIEIEALNNYTGNLYLANDFDTFRLDREGKLFKVE